MTYSPTRDYSAKFKFENSQDYYDFIVLLLTKPKEISNICLYETHEIKILMGEHLPEEQGYDKKCFYVIFDVEIPKHYGIRRWLKERFETEPDVCWYHYYFLMDKHPLQIFEDEL